jgi:hypothetical protein
MMASSLSVGDACWTTVHQEVPSCEGLCSAVQMCVDFPAMTTDKTPEPLHDWSANHDADIRPFGTHDRCLSCYVLRYSPMSGMPDLRSNAVAAGPCPQQLWRDLPESEIQKQVNLFTGNETPIDIDPVTGEEQYR